MSGGWLGDSVNSPCEMGGRACVDYGRSTAQRVTVVTGGKLLAARLEALACEVEQGRYLGAYGKRSRALRIRALKEKLCSYLNW